MTCMSTIKKSIDAETAPSLLIIATESKYIYIIEPNNFVTVRKILLPAVTAFIQVDGF